MHSITLPGEYTLCVRYNYSGDYSKSGSTDCTNLNLIARPGHVYYVYPSFPAADRWKPTVADFSGNEDYSKFSHGLLDNLDDGNDLKSRAERYFKGERAFIRFSERGYWE